jgi:hypothetical protein
MSRRWLLALLPASLATLSLLPAPSSAQSGPTQVAAIETTAPLDDQSEGAVKSAIATAVQTAARGAVAMGLPWVRIKSAYVRDGYVGVQVFAMARPPDDPTDESGDAPRLSPGDDNGQPVPGETTEYQL